ncbi:hypothetical protein [Aliiglaciecola sp. LCG003]|uniref:hypothetical protein n=1 Tax=Aliiglaciecola sp. LCG003 TaxID=3053655 RepID=UPI0025739878|nr:hypothetical protein [Aliiglaciecola sp. LCG003]WJG08254.1 hypothetical protein QR722_13000 [Aliiglaciecola sp. LCG003]
MKVLVNVALLLAIGGCAGEAIDNESAKQADVSLSQANKDESKQEPAKMLTIKGTIVYKSLEGGFFALDAQDGKKYMPRGMDKSLLKNGMVVEVQGVVLTDVMTFQQYGEVLKVVQAKMIDDSQVTEPNSY